MCDAVVIGAEFFISSEDFEEHFAFVTSHGGELTAVFEESDHFGRAFFGDPEAGAWPFGDTSEDMVHVDVLSPALSEFSDECLVEFAQALFAVGYDAPFFFHDLMLVLCVIEHIFL